MTPAKRAARRARAKKMLAYLKRAYPHPKSELAYETPIQFVVAVIFSAQCTDKAVNRLTATIFKKYRTPEDFAGARLAVLTKEISSIPFFRNKANAVIRAAKDIVARYGSTVPRTSSELTSLPGVGYKTAHVILGELYDEWDGIPTDTHVKRFAKRLDLTDADDLTKISKDLESLVPKKDWKYVNNGLVLYGRYICPARPHECSAHPLTKLWPPAAKRWPKVK